MDVSDFTYTAPPARVLFGPGRVNDLAEEIDRLGVARVMVAATPNGATRYKSIVGSLSERCAGVFSNAQPHCPEDVALAAVDNFKISGADAVVTIGGGSTIGLGKVIAARCKVPFVAIPTTLSGSEMTALYGMKIGDEKRTWNDPAAKACGVIYDPDLIASLPRHEIATTGMNCLAHCIEALYPAQPNPIARLLALDAIRVLGQTLPAMIETNDAQSRAGVLYGGFIGGLLVSMVGIGLHHKICHVIGGHFDLPHGETNSVVLPYVVAFNAPAMPAIADDIAHALGSNDAVHAIFELAARIGVPGGLSALGLSRSDLLPIAREIVAKNIQNPRPVTLENISALLAKAWAGERPA